MNYWQQALYLSVKHQQNPVQEQGSYLNQIDKSGLETNGFKNSFYYRSGGRSPSSNNGTHNKISWNGNSSESVYEVYDKITLLKSVTDCPRNSSFRYKKKLKDFEGNLVGEKPLNFSLTMALYPNYKCCKTKLPNLEDVDISYHWVKIKEVVNSSCADKLGPKKREQQKRSINMPTGMLKAL